MTCKIYIAHLFKILSQQRQTRDLCTLPSAPYILLPYGHSQHISFQQIKGDPMHIKQLLHTNHFHIQEYDQ